MLLQQDSLKSWTMNRPATASYTAAPQQIDIQAAALSPAEVVATATTIAETQLPSGLIPWFDGGHADPWNHTEAAMALTVGGFFAEAQKAYDWLAAEQLPNGAWHQYYWADPARSTAKIARSTANDTSSKTAEAKTAPRNPFTKSAVRSTARGTRTAVKDDKLDTNCVAYVATGVWHYFLSTGDRGFLEELLPVVHNAVEFVCDAQTPRGEIHWARHADGKFWPFALLTGSSSISHSFECALKLAAAVGEERPRWQEAQDRLRPVIAKVPEAFAPKKRWAMDWYYPVLSGALTGQEARKRLREGWEKFVMEGKGVRCVADKEWVTAAETAECAIAHFIAGETETAKELLGWTNHLRASDNRYWTGMAYPDRVHFPAEEKTTYTAAAVILAADVIGADGDVAEADDLDSTSSDTSSGKKSTAWQAGTTRQIWLPL